jgi:hypothetical protein
MSHIVGVFNDPQAASRAVDQLVEAHFAPRREILVTSPNSSGVQEEVPIVHKTRVPIGLALGLGFGLLLGAVVAVTNFGTELPDLGGGILAGGGVLRIAVLAAGIGSLIGVLWGLTYWSDKPDFSQARAGSGSPIQVSVDATNLRGRADEARLIFERAGAVEVQ